MKGISTYRRCTPHAECIKREGFDFVIRYYSQTTGIPEKVVTPEEAAAIMRAGMKLAIVYQDSNNFAGYFNQAEGKKDGSFAYKYAQKLQQPGGSAIYFAVDYDASLTEIKSKIRDYFQGVKRGFDDLSGGKPIYDIGIYGSGAACRWIRSNLPFVKYSWLALATGWLGSKDYSDWDIKQVKVKEDLCSLPAKDWQDVTVNRDFGQFTIPIS